MQLPPLMLLPSRALQALLLKRHVGRLSVSCDLGVGGTRRGARPLLHPQPLPPKEAQMCLPWIKKETSFVVGPQTSSK